MIIDAFNDVERKPLESAGGLNGQDYLNNLYALQVGKGSNAFRSDQSGIWLGAEKFANAPFRVNMAGNLVATSADLSAAGYTKINIFKQAAIPTSISIGDLWFDTDDGNKLYRAAAVGATTIAAGQWELVGSTAITVFAQDGIPTSLAIGDIWYDTDDGNKPYRADSVGATTIAAGQWEAVDDQRAADALLKAGTAQVLSGDIQIGVSGVKIDGANKRIIINDGSFDRILIGWQSGGF
jgi:hypothetical protein